MARITEGITLSKLCTEGCEFQVQLDPEADAEIDKEAEDLYQTDLLKYTNLDCLGGNDNTYDDKEPFEKIAEGMINILPDGRIKKRVLREGYGELPPKNAIIKMDYNAYLEYNAEPLDSTYARKQKHEFVLQNGDVLPGLDMSVATMKINEKAQFLVSPDLAYGKLGCLKRIPPNATILYEVELHEIVDSGAAMNFDKLSLEEQEDFQNLYKYCLAVCEQAKDKFKRNIKDAIFKYNQAVCKLEKCVLSDYAQQEKQQELLLKMYVNLLVCYTKTDEPKKGCRAAKCVYSITKGTTVPVPAKVYFCHAKCLRNLGEYQQAKQKLIQAQRIEPRNPEICNEFLLLEEEAKSYKENQKKMAENFIGKLQ